MLVSVLLHIVLIRCFFQWYRRAHTKDMPIQAIAHLIHTMLYARRFFPYYVFILLGGIEEDGTPNGNFTSS